MKLFELVKILLLLNLFGSTALAEKIYLVRYTKSDLQMTSKLSVSDTKSFFQQRTLQLEKELLMRVGIKPEKIKSLWILEGSIVAMNSQQLRTVQSKKFVESVIPLGRKVTLYNRFEPSIEELNLKDFTYGLIKINFPQVQARYLGLDGRGVRIGIIDTGISVNHPEFQNRSIIFRDFVQKRKAPYDDHGHGNHVAGTVAGGNASGRQIGLASGADLIIAKAFNARGNSVDADLLLALQWMTDPDENPTTDDGAHFINNSWNTEVATEDRTPESDPFCEIIPRLKALGTLPVFAAGNDGPRGNTVTPPAACPGALAVGATDQDDLVADFSSRGPVRWKNLVIQKPDLVAPGKGVLSADRDRGYRTRSGTSMAAPHVTGALALLKQASPDLTLQEQEDLIKQATLDIGRTGVDDSSGSGRLDLMKGLLLIEER